MGRFYSLPQLAACVPRCFPLDTDRTSRPGEVVAFVACPRTVAVALQQLAHHRCPFGCWFRSFVHCTQLASPGHDFHTYTHTYICMYMYVCTYTVHMEQGMRLERLAVFTFTSSSGSETENVKICNLLPESCFCQWLFRVSRFGRRGFCHSPLSHTACEFVAQSVYVCVRVSVCTCVRVCAVPW